MVRVISDEAVAEVLSMPALLDVVADAFRKQRAGAVERPDRPHFPVGIGLDVDDPGRALGTGLTMPAAIHGAETYATKLASVHEDNPDRGLPTVNAQIALTDAETGLPVAYLAGNRITNARTGCIGGNAVRHLVDGPVRLAVFGAGTQARWQTRAIAAAVGSALESVAIYSPSDSKHECASELGAALGSAAADGGSRSTPRISAAETATDALDDANVVVTATTSTEPVFDDDDLSAGALVVAIGAYTPEMMELDGETVDRAERVYADVPDEAVETGDLAGRRSLDAIAPFADSFDDAPLGSDEIVLVASVGSAVLDAASAEYVYEAAAEAEEGVVVDL